MIQKSIIIIQRMKYQLLVLSFFLVGFVNSDVLNVSTFAPIVECQTNDDCLWGYFCNNNKCMDKCAMMRCTSQTICKQGQCHQICNEKTLCQEGYYCDSLKGYCLDRCRFTKCAGDHYCEKGKCLPISKQCSVDTECKTGFYCSTKGQCIDKCEIENYCNQEQTCEAGICSPIIATDPIQTPACPTLIECERKRPNEKTCPTVNWFRKPDPLVCGMTKKGKLIDFPLECYACKNKSIVSYFNTTCDSIPLNCIDSNIFNPPTCKKNQIIKDNKCVPIGTTLNQIKCNSPRPDQKTCPTIYWIRQPDPVVCGVDKNGKYIDFPVLCYACKQKDIVSYYNTTCSVVTATLGTSTGADLCKDIFCIATHTCVNGKCVPIKI